MQKYHSRKTELDGILFHSQREARRYQDLKLMEIAGEIQGLELQVKYPLVVNEVKIGTYIADFRYKERGVVVVEDVKSEPTKTPVYRIKKKLVRAIYGIEIKET